MSKEMIIKEISSDSNEEQNSLSKISSIKVMDEQSIKDWSIKDPDLQIISSNGNEPLYLIEEDNDINIYSTTKLYKRVFLEILDIKHKIVISSLLIIFSSLVTGILVANDELMSKPQTIVILPLLFTISAVMCIIESRKLSKVNKIRNYLFKNSGDFFKFKQIKNHKQIEDKNAEDKKQKINILL